MKATEVAVIKAVMVNGKTYRTPIHAANAYADWHTHQRYNMRGIWPDYITRQNRFKKVVRRVLPIFERLLK
jgi:hypothetical protein